MAWTKAKTAVVVGVAVLLTAGTGVVGVKVAHALRSQPEISGAWEGVISTKVGKLRVVMHLTKSDGKYRATMDSIDQRTTGIPANKLTYDYPTLNFESEAVKGTFEGKVDNTTGEISGTWKQPMLDTKLVMKRTTTPTPIPPVMSPQEYAPRAGSDLQGYWVGTLKVGTTSLKLGFKFSEPPGEAIRGELDSIDQGVDNIVVSTVQYDRPDVRAEVNSIGGVFEGQLDTKTGEIKGTWTQAMNALPLVLQRSDSKTAHARQAAKAAKMDYAYEDENDLRGHWQGVLDVKGMKLHLALHVGKFPDGSLGVLMDSIDQGATGLSAQTVRFTPPNVHLEWQTIGGVYDGSVKNGKLSGTWKQGGMSLPLAFDRSDN